MGTTTRIGPTVLSPEAIESLPAEPLGHVEGATHRVLWHSNGSVAGLLTLPAGSRLGAHSHRVHHHHVWVVDGSAIVLGQLLEPGSYVHVPAGVEHDIDTTDTDGCTVFYLYAPPGG